MDKPERLIRFTQNLSTDAAIVTSNLNRRYLTGFLGTAGTLFVTGEQAWYLADGRYFEAVQEKVPFVTPLLVQGGDWEPLSRLCREQGVKTLAFEDLTMTVSVFRKLEEALPEVTLVPMGNALLKQRALKDEGELSMIRRAQKITDEAYGQLVTEIHAGMTERQVAHRLEELLFAGGATSLAFDTIAVGGPHSSLPHGRPSDYVLRDGDFLTLDFGAAYEGYCSDMTRTVAFGHVTDEMRRVYSTVLEAQEQSIKMIAPGVSCKEIDAFSRSVMAKEGLEEFFIHSLGHSFGLEIHELPGLSRTSEDVLAEGMVMTVEPGIYLPGRFGVRIEDDVFVTKTGCINLTSSPKELLVL